MKRKSKILSFVLSFVMIFSIIFTLPISTKAETKAPQFDKKAFIQKHLKNFKDVDYKKALSQKYGVEALDDNSSSENKVINPDDEVRVIVELQGTTVYEQSKSKKLSLSEKKAIEQNIENAQKPVIDKVKYYGKIRHSYKNLLNGFSATVKFKDIDAIRELPNVKKVTVANKYYLDMNSARGITNTETVWQDLGYKGEGMVVAIVDTGIDYTHKDMRLTDSSKAKLNKTIVEQMGGPGHFYTDKVPYGYNFADMNDQVMDLGPGASMHGMHVAGIVAANGTDDEVKNNAAIKGVAPEAQLLAMKVFTNNPDMPSAYSDDIAAAIDDSVKHGADVINMSLGSTAGFVNYDDPEQIAIQKATEAGVIVVVSGGNSYYSTYPYSVAYAMDPDISMVGSPGLFPDTLQVASSENNKIALNTLKVYIDGAQEPINIAYQKQESPDPVKVFGDRKLEAVYVGTGEPKYYEGKDVAGKLVFAVRTGGYYYKYIQQTAEQYGAAGVIIRGSLSHGDYVNMALDNPQIPVVSLSINDGNNLMNAALAGKKLEFTFTNDKMLVDNATANQMSDFSSWGTTPDLEFKPEVSAPGGKIYSTVNNNEYTMMSGTSMAAPHTSGATALVAQYVKKTMPTLSGKDFVNMVKTLLINSAEPMLDPSTGNKLPYLTRKQGAGVIKTDKAIKTGAYVTTDDGKAVIALKEITGSKGFKLKVKNFSDKDLTFKVVNKYGVLTNYYTSSGLMYPKAAVLNGASLIFDKETITVKKGETGEIIAILTVPSTANNKFAEGYIVLESQTEGQPNLGIPYMGFCGKWSGQDAPRMIDAPMWDYDTFYGITSLFDSKGYYLGQVGEDENGLPIIDTSKIAFSPNGDEIFDDVMPIVSFMRNAKEFKVQVVDENGKVVRDISYDKNVRKNNASQQLPAKLDSNWVWDGKIFNSSKLTYELAPEGNYKIRLLAKPDFKDADWYTLDMPVKLDLTPPDFDFDIQKVQGNEFKVKIKNLSDDIKYYGYFVCDKDGNFLWDDYLNVDSNGEVMVNLINGDCYFGVVAFDYAGNSTDKLKEIINTSFEVSLPEDCILNNGYPPVETNNSATINVRINEALRPVLDHIGVKVVNAGNTREEVTLTPSETSYKIENLVDGGCTVNVNLYGKDNKVLAEDTLSFIVDLTPPQITLLNTTGSSIVLTNGEKEYNLQFKVSDMSTGFKVLLNGKTVAEEYNSLGSLYEKTFDIPVQINEGENKFTIKAVDLAGHEAVSDVTINSTLDKPVIVANYPQYIGDKKVIVSGNVAYKSGVAISEFNINGEAVQLNGNNFVKEISFDSFGDKAITYYVKAEDGAYNTFTQNFKLSPIIFENRNYKTKENSQTINFNIVQDDTLNDAKLFVNFKGNETEYPITTSSSITVENLNDGNNIVEFIIKDKDGKEIVRDYVEIFVEKELPYITAFDDNKNNISGGQIYKNGNVHITGQVSEPVKYLKYKVYGKDEESDWANIQVNEEGLFEATLNLFEGMNRVTFEMEDESGNINSYQAKMWVDTTPPILTIEPNETNVVTNKDEYAIKINVKENTYSYRLYVNENQIDYGESESIEGVEKTIEYNYKVPNGTSNVVIKAVDIVGNTTTSSISFYKEYTKLDDSFNKNVNYEKANGGNIDFNITFNGDKLNSIMYNNKLLKEGKDYAVGDNKITLKEDFLMTLPVGENKLVFSFISKDYEIVINVKDSRSTDATLAGIKVGDNILSGFRADKYEYEYEVNPMLTKPLTVSAIVSDPKAKVEITQATEVEGTAVIKVTAQDGTVKTYTIKFIIPLKLEMLNNVSQFAKNIDAVIKVKATNISKALKNAQLIIGLFDKDNKLVNYVAGGYEIKSGEEVVMEGQIKTPNEAGYYIKCFVWDILNNQNPLSKVFEFLIK